MKKPGNVQTATTVRHTLETIADNETATRADVQRLAELAREMTGPDGRAGAQLAQELRRIERQCRFQPAAKSLFQNLLGKLGVDSSEKIRIPVDDLPYWMRATHPLMDYRSRPKLPDTADVIIVGAGLTGASAAYGLAH